MKKISLYTAVDMTYGILSSMSVQGYHNAKCLVNAMDNLKLILDTLTDYNQNKTDVQPGDGHDKQTEVTPDDAQDRQGQDV